MDKCSDWHADRNTENKDRSVVIDGRVGEVTASHNHNKTVKQIIYESQTKDFSHSVQITISASVMKWKKQLAMVIF